jgi:ribonuclease P protein component
MNARLGLPRASRLRTGRDFARPKSHGQRVTRGCLALNWLERPDAPAPRVGVVTSRKLGGAVVRARARRLLREAFRLHQRELARAADLVLVARPSIVGRSLAQVEADYLAALKSGGLLK